MKRTLLAAFILAQAAWPATINSRNSRNAMSAVFRHRVHEARRQADQQRTALALQPETANAVLPDSGQIAIIDDSDDVLISGFNLDQKTLEFKPADVNATRYTYDVAASRFDSSIVSTATKVPLADDDSKEIGLPFLFPFYGFRYSTAFIGSDGHITFGMRDDSQWQTGEDPGFRMVAGPPRLAPLYNNLDPSQPNASVSYFSSASRFVVTWQNVPLFGPSTPRQTFQSALYPDGRIEFSYNGINVATVPGVAVGIAQGGDVDVNGNINPALYALVDFSTPLTSTLNTTIVEEFLNRPSFDVVSAADKFYRNHDDAYDFLAIYDTVDRTASMADCGAGSIPLQNSTHGIGLAVAVTSTVATEEFNESAFFGSSGRLQHLSYMGPLSHYPSSQTQPLPAGDTCGSGNNMSLLGYQVGLHFVPYLAFQDSATGQPSIETITDPNGSNPGHWGFYFNSDASLMGGNRILDHGAGTSPRFETQQILQHYSALDEYAMGLRAPADVPTTFLVRNPSIARDFPADHAPQAGELFDGTRVDITLSSIAAVMGPRAPDATLSPKRFRFGFALIVPAGTTPAQADLSKLDAIRTAWQSYFATATDNRGQADTTLVKQVRLSVWPASGIIQGHTINASVTLGAPAAAAVTITLAASGSSIGVPASVTISAGSRSATFTITGNTPGTVLLTAQGPDNTYETSTASILVRANEAGLTVEPVDARHLAFGFVVPPLTATEGVGPKLDDDLAFRVRDDNYLPYPGLQLNATASGSGGVVPASLVTDAFGFVGLAWRLDGQPGPNTLTVSLADQPGISSKVTAVGVIEPAHLRDLR